VIGERDGGRERERGKKTAVAEIEKTNKVGTEIATSLTTHNTTHNAAVV
jgi:acyl-coenzyme A thioesterase PaaI-like protein